MEKSTWFYLGNNTCMSMLYNLLRINEMCKEHVENNFLPLPEAHVRDFQAVRGAVDTLFADTLDMMANGELETVNLLRRHCDEIKDIISDTYHNLHYQLREGDARSMTVLYVYLNTLQETQEMVSAMRKFLRAFAKMRNTDYSGRPNRASARPVTA